MEIVETTSAPSVIRLNEDFLSPYRAKGDPFKSLLARSTYLTKYCRDMEDGKKETWTDTIRRVVEGNVALASGVQRTEAELLFHLFWTGQALPPGRGLWVGGVPGIPADARFNCFAGETKFWANGVLVSLQDVVGETVEVLTVDGQWRPAEVKNFGRQKLLRYVLKLPRNSHFTLEYTATPNHRWFTGRGEVTDLRVGDTITVSPSSSSRWEDDPEYLAGFAHGFVFGDGSKEFGKRDTYRLRLCAEKDLAHLARLKQAPTYHSETSPPSFQGDPLLFFRSEVPFKQLPDDTMGLAYLAGFLAGWMAADGSLRTGGSGGNRLCSINASALDWVAERAPLLGYCVTGRSIDPSRETNFGKRDAQIGVLTLVPEPQTYKVVEVIDEGREEDVYCVSEPVTRSFTLAGGVVTGNCWWTTLYGIDDWCWMVDNLMLGGGVGVGLAEINNFPVVRKGSGRFAIWCGNHPNVDEVKPNDRTFLNGQTPVFKVDDSREGWVAALRRVLLSGFAGEDLIVDLSSIRPRGKKLKTFGGVACGPGPLAHMLRSIWSILRKAEGRKLSSVDALDITNHIGLCIKSGNVRRSALIILGEVDDADFRKAKLDWEAVQSHRHTSNNSVVFRTWDQISSMDWKGLVEENSEYGEPGIVNLPLVWRTDPGAKGFNPCAEIALHDREACNLAEVFPAFSESDLPTTLRLVTRYTLRQRLTALSDPKANEVQQKNMRLGVGLGGLCDFDWTTEDLAGWYKVCRQEADRYSEELGVNRPITVTTVKPSGTISLLNGSSPGDHAPHAPYYIRRTRIAKNDPMASAMMEAGVPFEEDVYDKTGHTWVFEFPTKAPHTRVTGQTETLREQFERQKQVQQWWADNAVSQTLNFDPATDREELAACLQEYVPHLKSTSCLPKSHGYAQAPYEAISEDDFNRMAKNINHNHPLVSGGDIDVMDCANGVCPIQ